jgi:hypothetical protein
MGCSTYGLLKNGPWHLNAGDTVTIDVNYTSRLYVPGTSTFNFLQIALPDIYAPGAAVPGSNKITGTSILKDYIGPSDPITSGSNSSLHDYLALSGFCCGYKIPNDGFSVTGITLNETIDTTDPDPIYIALFGYVVGLSATPEVLASFAGGTVDHPVILPDGLTGQISSAISGGAAERQYYGFKWSGGLFQTVGSIAGANPLADFHFQLIDPYSLAVIDGADLLLNDANDFTDTISRYLSPGYYEIGMYTDSPYDPQFTIHFNTPVSGIVPEPDSWAMMLLGFGAVGFASRRRRTQAQLG